MVRRFVTAEADASREQAHLPLAERRCPVCGHLGIRRYYQLFTAPATASLFTYIWCPACHTYEGSTARHVAGLVLDRDPMAELGAERRGLLKRQLDAYFTQLDEFWERGALPQRLTWPNGRPYAPRTRRD